jgi:hypothetical protein
VRYELDSYILEDGILHSHHRENLKSDTVNVVLSLPILVTPMMEVIPHDLIWARNRAALVGSRGLAA